MIVLWIEEKKIRRAEERLWTLVEETQRNCNEKDDKEVVAGFHC